MIAKFKIGDILTTGGFKSPTKLKILDVDLKERSYEIEILDHHLQAFVGLIEWNDLSYIENNYKKIFNYNKYWAKLNE